jgi:magnesium transporter
MIRSLVFTTQGKLHSRDIEMFLMPTLLKDTNLFLWVDLENPTPEEIKFILDNVFHFHPLSIEDCVAVSHSPKVEEYQPQEDDLFAPYLFMVIHAVDYSRQDGVFATKELDFFLGKNFLITHHTAPMRTVSQTEDRAIKGTMRIARAPDRVAHELLDSIVENYNPALDELSEEIEELEQAALQTPTHEILNDGVESGIGERAR